MLKFVKPEKTLFVFSGFTNICIVYRYMYSIVRYMVYYTY